MKKILTISLLLCGASVYAADGSSPNQTKKLDKIFITNAVAGSRRDGRTTEYGEYFFNDKGDPSELRSIHSGDTHYEFYPQTMRSITTTTTAEELTKSIQDGGPFDWKKLVARLYCDGKLVDPKDFIITHSPLISWPKKDEKVWNIRKNATKWVLVHYTPGAPIKDKVPKALRMGREGRKFIQTTEYTYKAINQEATARYHGHQGLNNLSDWELIEKNS